MSVRRQWLLVPLLAALLLSSLIALPRSARADGDPASDWLYTETVFFPFNGSISPAAKDRLQLTVRAAREAGYPVKVALIGQPADLGAVPALFDKPQDYARFLGLELSLLYKGPLLIVMPNGFGIFHLHKPVTSETQTLQGLPVGKDLSGMADSASEAIQRLAAASGHQFAAVTVPSNVSTTPVAAQAGQTISTSGGGTKWVIIVAPVAAFITALIIIALLTNRAGRARAEGPEEEPPDRRRLRRSSPEASSAPRRRRR